MLNYYLKLYVTKLEILQKIIILIIINNIFYNFLSV